KARRSTVLFALFAALTIGWRIQFSIFVVPLFLVGVALMRGWRPRSIALLVFTLVCVVWLIPLTLAVGGVRELIDFETGQGKYVATHDAAESRTGWTPVRIAFRFVGRAWGTELMALVALGIATFGFVVVARTRLRAFLPLAAGAAVYIGVALWVMDPADGVRYAIPFVLATAFVFGAGVMVLPLRFAYAAVVLMACAFLVYVGPMLSQRRSIASPPVRAAEFARAAYPPNAVALYELPLWPHAMYYLRDRNPRRVDEGLAEFYDRPEVPLFIYADGATTRTDARVFRWKTSDAYEKLTRNHYRTASVIPVPPERRFRVVSGISVPERDQDGLEWRWLSSPAELQLPRGPARSLTLRLGLPPAAPLESNTISISVDGRRVTDAHIARAEHASAGITIPVPAGAPIIRLDAARTFIPAEVPAMRSGDRRVLAVELYDLRTSAAAAPTPRPPS
ncbi:MAG TPA: hypothetical protein VHL59_19615, partial [Thermoanaerobaculia bacterium]|nr:hypothetical protein [Thermoanaerobaculia bacterium]